VAGHLVVDEPHGVSDGDGVAVALDDDDDEDLLLDPLGTPLDDDCPVEDDALFEPDALSEADALEDVLDAPTVDDELDGLLGVGVQDGVGPALVEPGELGCWEVEGAELVGAGRLDEEDRGVLADEDGRGACDEELLPERGAELDELLCDDPEDEVEPLLVAGSPGITAGVPLA
jgi:hypothetical protein